jgi:hypothetical protein
MIKIEADIRDIEDERSAGVLTLNVLLGEARSTVLYRALALLWVVLACVAGRPLMGVPAIAFAIDTWLGRCDPANLARCDYCWVAYWALGLLAAQLAATKYYVLLAYGLYACSWYGA